MNHEESIVQQALKILEARAHYGDHLGSPDVVANMLKLRLGALEYEEFSVCWLDAQNRMIAFESMFRGTLTQTSVYPREVVKAALKHNAASVIFAHNHPSGITEPSRADEMLTRTLKDALGLVDVKVLDHFIVSACETMSFAQRGLI